MIGEPNPAGSEARPTALGPDEPSLPGWYRGGSRGGSRGDDPRHVRLRVGVEGPHTGGAAEKHLMPLVDPTVFGSRGVKGLLNHGAVREGIRNHGTAEFAIEPRGLLQ